MACNWHVMDRRVGPVANLKILTTASPFRSLVIIARLLFSLVYWHMALLMKNASQGLGAPDFHTFNITL